VSAAEPKIVYTPRPEIASEIELGTLAEVYRRAVQRYEEKLKAAERPLPAGPDDAEDIENDRTTTASIHR
jgi:hypothetical protein